MKYYISVRFNNTNKGYYFATDDPNIKLGDFVVIDTSVGREIGEVISNLELMENLKFNQEVKPILRIATKEDFKIREENFKLANYASEVFNNAIRDLNLNMNLLNTQYTLDKTKILFTYASDERIDFRDLLKTLANKLHCRIELKQVNSRERAQLIGGIGSCGLPLCCTTFLKTFDSISLNRAKNQMLTINIPKLSGQCGKLMCCLKYEDDLYTEEKKKFPPLGTKLKIDNTEYKITSMNILTKIIKLDSKENVLFLSLEEVNKYLKKGNFKKNER